MYYFESLDQICGHSTRFMNAPSMGLSEGMTNVRQDLLAISASPFEFKSTSVSLDFSHHSTPPSPLITDQSINCLFRH